MITDNRLSRKIRIKGRDHIARMSRFCYEESVAGRNSPPAFTATEYGHSRRLCVGRQGLRSLEAYDIDGDTDC